MSAAHWLEDERFNLENAFGLQLERLEVREILIFTIRPPCPDQVDHLNEPNYYPNSRMLHSHLRGSRAASDHRQREQNMSEVNQTVDPGAHDRWTWSLFVRWIGVRTRLSSSLNAKLEELPSRLVVMEAF